MIIGYRCGHTVSSVSPRSSPLRRAGGFSVGQQPAGGKRPADGDFKRSRTGGGGDVELMTTPISMGAKFEIVQWTSTMLAG